MGKVKHGTVCSVADCNESATRSVATDKAKEALQQIGAVLKDERARRVYLCQNHYKLFKKQTKHDKKVDKWRYSA